DQRVLEQEVRAVAAKARVPTEETEPALGHVLREVVLGEIDLVVRRDERDLGSGTPARVVDALTRITAVSGTRGRGGFERDEAAVDVGHSLPRANYVLPGALNATSLWVTCA